MIFLSDKLSANAAVAFERRKKMNIKTKMAGVSAFYLFAGFVGTLAFTSAFNDGFWLKNVRPSPFLIPYSWLWIIPIPTWIFPVSLLTFICRKHEEEIHAILRPLGILVFRLCMYFSFIIFALTPISTLSD